VKIKKKKPTQLSTLNHSHVAAPQRDSSTHHTPPHHSKVHPPHAARGGMAHEEQNDPVAQSSASKSPTTSTADLSERDNKENPVVKEEEIKIKCN
jgi:hypothetical protein